MKTIIFLCGIYSLGFAMFHIGFWKLFRWKTDLVKLQLPNREVMQILNIQLIFYFIFAAFVCFNFSTELLDTQLGKVFIGANVIFWFIRTIQQFIFFKPNFVINTLTIIFIIGTILFALPLII
jgi:hypothetical protein